MNNIVLCSTGTYIDKLNNYDYKLIPKYAKEIKADGFELMFLHFWYPYLDDVVQYLKESKVNFVTIHFDKQIGSLFAEGTNESLTEGFRKLELNCNTAKCLGIKKAVLHLWGVPCSDSNFNVIQNKIPQIIELGNQYGIEILFENIPCSSSDPLSHWKEILEVAPNAHFIADTRFLAFHSQFEQIIEEGWFDGKVKHMHVSDFAGIGTQFDKLRPILMPGEGTIGDKYDYLFDRIKEKYNNSITLESPAKIKCGILDIESLNNAILFIRNKVSNE